MFSDVPETELAGLAEHARARRYEAGERILHRGSRAEHLYVVDHGRVDVEMARPDGGELPVRQIAAGQCFGELALLEGVPRSTDVVAVTTCRLLAIARDDFLRFVRIRPRVADRLLTVMRQELREDEDLLERRDLQDLGGSLTQAIKLLAAEEEAAEPVVEVLPITLRDDGVWWFRPDGAPSWHLASDVSRYPGDLVLDGLVGLGVRPRAIHSTSWRYEGEHLVLTYAGVLPDQTAVVPTLVEAPVRRVDLARGSATGPPDEIQVAQVVEHALRHLSWLMRDDPVLATILTGAWVGVLEGYEPEPFRALNREDVAEE